MVVQYVRCRLNVSAKCDAIDVLNEEKKVYNLILDHCSVAWGGWDNIDYGQMTRRPVYTT